MDHHINRNRLMDSLLDHNVPLDQWGSRAVQKIDRLAEEIESGSASIRSDSEGLITCTFKVTEVDVLYQRQILVRDKIILNTTTSRPLVDVLGATISVPMERGEIPLAAAARSLRDFFSLPGGFTMDLTIFETITVGPRATGVYPGINVLHVLYPFDWNLPRKYFNPAGYVREESIGDVHYDWLSSDVIY